MENCHIPFVYSDSGAGGTAVFEVCGMDGLGGNESSDTLRIFIVEMLRVFGGLFSFLLLSLSFIPFVYSDSGPDHRLTYLSLQL